MRILIIDDDQALCRSLQIQLEATGHQVTCAHDGATGLASLAPAEPDLIFLDLKLPDQSGLDVLSSVAERFAGLPVVMITGTQDMMATIEAMRRGAFDYIRKPIGREDVLLAMEKARRQAQLHRSPEEPSVGEGEAPTDTDREFVGKDPRILEVLKQIGLLSRSDVTVLIEGESGTGKELIARALHAAGKAAARFVAINCSSIVSTLPESELFGHEKGAFTGAERRKIGKLEFAGSGTLFLDEIGDLALDLQAKLLRVLQEREFERVGGLESLPFQARVIAATNHNLKAQTEAGRFREDLYYRLAVSRIAVPPLRERRGDIPLLIHHLTARIARRIHRPIPRVDKCALQRLVAYDWPGNVRELENVLTRAIALARGTVLTAGDLTPMLGAAEPDAGPLISLRAAEKRHVAAALAAYEWNITRAAAALEISPTTLRKKIADYDLHPPV